MVLATYCRAAALPGPFGAVIGRYVGIRPLDSGSWSDSPTERIHPHLNNSRRAPNVPGGPPQLPARPGLCIAGSWVTFWYTSGLPAVRRLRLAVRGEGACIHMSGVEIAG